VLRMSGISARAVHVQPWELQFLFLELRRRTEGNWGTLTMTRLMTMAFCMLCIVR
jgi:hypothetical protein